MLKVSILARFGKFEKTRLSGFQLTQVMIVNIVDTEMRTVRMTNSTAQLTKVKGRVHLQVLVL